MSNLKDNFIKELLSYKDSYYTPLPNIYLSGISDHAYNLKKLLPNLSKNLQDKYKKLKEKYGEFEFELYKLDNPVAVLKKEIKDENSDKIYIDETRLFISELGFYVNGRDENKLHLRIKDFSLIYPLDEKIGRNDELETENIIDYDDSHFDLENDLEWYVVECPVFLSSNKNDDDNDNSFENDINGFIIPTEENLFLISNYGHVIDIWMDEEEIMHGRFRRSDSCAGYPKKINEKEPVRSDYKDEKDYENAKKEYDKKIEMYDKRLKRYNDSYLVTQFTDPESSTDSGTKDMRTHLVIGSMGIKNDDMLKYSCMNHKDSNRKNPIITNIEWCTSKYNAYESVIRHNTNKPIVIYDINNNILCGIKVFNAFLNYCKEIFMVYEYELIINNINKKKNRTSFNHVNIPVIINWDDEREFKNFRTRINYAFKHNKKFKLNIPIKDDNGVYQSFTILIGDDFKSVSKKDILF